MIPNSDKQFTFEDLMDLLYKQEKLETELFTLREQVKSVASSLWKQKLKAKEEFPNYMNVKGKLGKTIEDVRFCYTELWKYVGKVFAWNTKYFGDKKD